MGSFWGILRSFCDDCGDILGTFETILGHFWNPLVSFCGRFVTISGRFCDHSGVTLGSIWVILGLFWGHLGTILVSCCAFSPQSLGHFAAYFGVILVG